MSRGNQRVILPVIGQKDKSEKAETYNFIQKKKTVDEPMDYQKRCQELERDVESRNQTIYSIQRNFESLSGLLRTEKMENQGIRDELKSLKELISQYNSKDQQQRNDISNLMKQVNVLSNQSEVLNEERKLSQRLSSELQGTKIRIADLESIYQTYLGQIEKRIEESQALVTEKLHYQSECNRLRQSDTLVQELTNKISELEKIKLSLEKSIEEKHINLQLQFTNINQLTNLIDQLKKQQLDTQDAFKFAKSREQNYIQENQDLRQYQDVLLAKISTLNQQIESLTTQLQLKESQDAKNQSMRTQINKLTQDLNSANSQIQALNTINQQFGPLIEEYRQLSAQHGHFKLGELWQERWWLEQQNNKITQDLQEMKVSNKKLQQELSEYQTKHELSSQQLNEANQNITTYVSQISDLENRIRELELQVQTLELEINNLANNHTNKVQQTDSLSNKLKEAYDREAKLQSQIKEAGKEIHHYLKYKDLISQAHCYNEPIIIIAVKQVQEYKDSLQHLKNSNMILSDEVSEQQSLLTYKAGILEKVQTENVQLTKDLQVCEQNLRDKNRLQNQINELQTLNSQIEIQLAQKQTIIDDQTHAMLQQISQNEERQQQFKSQISELKKQLDKVQILNTNLTLENQKCENLKTELQKLQNLNDDMKIKEIRVQRELNSSKDDVFSLKLEIKTLQQRVSDLEKEMDQLNPQALKDMRSQLELKQREFNSQLENIETALRSQIVSITCRHCDEVLQKSITCAPCGHSYCQKCFKGNCSECHHSDAHFNNKQLDDLINKISYSQQILNTYK